MYAISYYLTIGGLCRYFDVTMEARSLSDAMHRATAWLPNNATVLCAVKL